MLASFPASMLNQKPSDLGILNRLKPDPSRSSQENRQAVLGIASRNDSGAAIGTVAILTLNVWKKRAIIMT
jgi:hypothetical protein